MGFENWVRFRYLNMVGKEDISEEDYGRRARSFQSPAVRTGLTEHTARNGGWWERCLDGH